MIMRGSFITLPHIHEVPKPSVILSMGWRKPETVGEQDNYGALSRTIASLSRNTIGINYNGKIIDNNCVLT